jgi:Mg2+/Co2+ transporter CorB
MSAAGWLSAGLALLLALAAFVLTGAEAALSAASRSRIAPLERAGNRRARRVIRMLDDPERGLAPLIVGARLAQGAAAALLATVLVVHFRAIGIVYAVAAVAILTLCCGVAPRALGLAEADRFALVGSRPIRAVCRLFGPLAGAARWIGSGLLALAGLPAPAALVPAGPVDDARKDAPGRADLGGLVDLKSLTVHDVMIHRTDMFAVDLSQGTAAIAESVLAAPYTRVPLWRDAPDNIVGVIHVKDLLRALDAAGNDASRLDIEEIARPVWFVPSTTSLLDQLKSFRRRRVHLAVVVDEYGVMLGIVTLEDIIEEIVGDISDEHDVAHSGVRPQLDGAVNVDGSVPIRDLNRTMEWSLPDDQATTIAGLVIHEARTIPEAGQTFTFHGFRFQVLRKQRNRIVALRVTPLDRGLPAG